LNPEHFAEPRENLVDNLGGHCANKVAEQQDSSADDPASPKQKCAKLQLGRIAAPLYDFSRVEERLICEHHQQHA
jgi:hypothetical protein